MGGGQAVRRAGVDLQRGVGDDLRGQLAGVAEGTIWSSSPWITRVSTSIFLRSWV